MRLFRRSRPAPVPAPLDPQEARVISAHGHTEESWAALPSPERVKARDTYTKAERFAA